MAIKGIIFDVSNTLIKPYPSTRPAPGVIDLINRLHFLGIKIFAFENNGPKVSVEHKLRTAGIYFDEVATSQETHKNKGSPEWVDFIKDRHNLKRNDLIYIGDSDQDMWTASHSRVLYFHAGWASTQGNYGILAPTPNWVRVVVEHILLKNHLWWWHLDTFDPAGRPVKKLTMIDANGAGDPIILKKRIRNVLKYGEKWKVGPLYLDDFLWLHLLASIYFEGLYEFIDYWTIQPGHTPGSFSPMTRYIDTSAKLFRDRYENDIILRGAEAMKSNEARLTYNIEEALKNQFNSIQVNAKYRGKLTGKNILYLDDFLTFGPTTEMSRNLLLEAGVTKITNVAIGKFGIENHVYSFDIQQWNPFQLNDWDQNNVKYLELNPPGKIHGTTNQLALDEFLGSYNAMSKEP